MPRKMKLLSGLLLAFSITAAYADDPSTTTTIHFTGSIMMPSCEFDLSQADNGNIIIGTYPTSDFTTAGSESNRGKRFTIKLNNCPTPTTSLPAVQLMFEGETVTSHPELLQVSKISTADAGETPATNIGIAINEGTGSTPDKLDLSGVEGQIYMPLPDNASDEIDKSFYAAYVAYATPVTGGPADADLQINLLYR